MSLPSLANTRTRFSLQSAAGNGALQYRPEIDGLRAIAVLSVIAFHAFPDFITGGFVGVDIFFVISGFLITGILLKQLASERFSYVDFYSRRARRILPALCLVLSACLLVGYIALLPEELANLGRHMAAAAAFAANLSFWQESGYFAPASEFQPLLHLWSLGIEEQFYLVWPVVLCFAWRWKRNLGLVAVTLTAASFALNVSLTHVDPTTAFYLPLSRFWELGLGCALAIFKNVSPRILPPKCPNPSRPRSLRPLFRHAPLLGVALIGICLFTFNDRTAFPGVAAALPTAGALLILASEQPSWFRQHVLTSRVLVFVGLISYPLYLWHWPILSFEAILHAGMAQPVYRVAAIVLSALLAMLTYWYLEVPIRHRREPSIGILLAGGAFAIGVIGAAIMLRQGLPSRFPPTV
jgi:peptidoglycan/LPS O-acetylase OafA/YrhL